MFVESEQAVDLLVGKCSRNKPSKCILRDSHTRVAQVGVRKAILAARRQRLTSRVRFFRSLTTLCRLNGNEVRKPRRPCRSIRINDGWGRMSIADDGVASAFTQAPQGRCHLPGP